MTVHWIGKIHVVNPNIVGNELLWDDDQVFVVRRITYVEIVRLVFKFLIQLHVRELSIALIWILAYCNTGNMFILLFYIYDDSHCAWFYYQFLSFRSYFYIWPWFTYNHQECSSFLGIVWPLSSWSITSSLAACGKWLINEMLWFNGSKQWVLDSNILAGTNARPNQQLYHQWQRSFYFALFLKPCGLILEVDPIDMKGAPKHKDANWTPNVTHTLIRCAQGAPLCHIL